MDDRRQTDEPTTNKWRRPFCEAARLSWMVASYGSRPCKYPVATLAHRQTAPSDEDDDDDDDEDDFCEAAHLGWMVASYGS
ncbi:hypothetical protein N7520_009465 [Penicillium odoratum]|uniref:uncharacterized protein n=1 Tax=Penicillium odoratum TaxID=1167516 RepID=UPI002546E380|nr:uncharacterized protein N7520_009465 [Penicillium odoratum]KAJ5752548.1 hypothetical protein N7520_009465 [Penicillium odoratum]